MAFFLCFRGMISPCRTVLSGTFLSLHFENGLFDSIAAGDFPFRQIQNALTAHNEKMNAERKHGNQDFLLSDNDMFKRPSFFTTCIKICLPRKGFSKSWYSLGKTSVMRS